jgi:hypothetical protein
MREASAFYHQKGVRSLRFTICTIGIFNLIPSLLMKWRDFCKGSMLTVPLCGITTAEFFQEQT